MTKTIVHTEKIKTYEEIEEILQKARLKRNKIVQCHGVFDLLHPGHIRHFKRAKLEGDILIVTLTPDRFVNKGPGRPVFTESLRLESLASLADVDFVILNDSPDAVSAIRKIKPNLYVKGLEYANAEDDITGKISDEIWAIESVGGKVLFTDDIVFSSSSLLNRFFDPKLPAVETFLQHLKTKCNVDEIIQKIEEISTLKVLVIGDAMIDEYQYADPLGQSGKGHHMVVRTLDKEIFLGGSFAVANHIAQFVKEVTLVTAIGTECSYLDFIHKHLSPNIEKEFTYLEETMTLRKKRYILKDGMALSKLFETYSGHEEPLNTSQTKQVVDYIKRQSSGFDLVLVCDFGNGFTNPAIVDEICNTSSFLSLNTQMNSGNRGYNVVTNYRKADFVSLNESELRLAMHDRNSSIEGLAADIGQILHCPSISVTKGIHGVFCFSNQEPSIHIPAFVTNSVDRIGAGDGYFSLSSLCMAKRYPLFLSGFIGSLAAAMSVQMIGNQEPIRKAPLTKFLVRLMK
ncbi:MAG TPA: PfkB family carbohydrate kinase [Chlamydiales bacterium]|nr:PfkB family carbohydrate kinase [Chlamydiales bacterium]